jgi:hypothetical protein
MKLPYCLLLTLFLLPEVALAQHPSGGADKCSGKDCTVKTLTVSTALSATVPAITITDTSVVSGTAFIKLYDGTGAAGLLLPTLFGKAYDTGTLDRQGLLLIGDYNNGGADNSGVSIVGRGSGGFMGQGNVLRLKNHTTKLWDLTYDGHWIPCGGSADGTVACSNAQFDVGSSTLRPRTVYAQTFNAGNGGFVQHDTASPDSSALFVGYGAGSDNTNQYGLKIVAIRNTFNNAFAGAVPISFWNNTTELGRFRWDQRLVLADGIQLNADQVNGAPRTKPACNSNTRGSVFFTVSSSGTKDALEVCAKDAADAYAWRLLY